MAVFPLKPIKKILKKHHRGEISSETVSYVETTLEHFTELLAKAAEKEFSDINKQRVITGLPPLKRLNKTTFQITWQKIYKDTNNKNTVGEVGNHNTTLLCQDGANNE